MGCNKVIGLRGVIVFGGGGIIFLFGVSFIYNMFFDY